uniref:Uncharacterized protein n=1 Tax=Rhodnius prolixus TaxID=13249 RepID=T1H8J6_RHOPR
MKFLLVVTVALLCLVYAEDIKHDENDGKDGLRDGKKRFSDEVDLKYSALTPDVLVPKKLKKDTEKNKEDKEQSNPNGESIVGGQKNLY